MQQQVSQATVLEKLGETTGGLLSCRSNPFVLQRAINLLRILRQAVELGELHWSPGFKLLGRIYGIGPQGEISDLHLALVTLAAAAEAIQQKGTDLASLAELKKWVLGAIDHEVENLTCEMKLLFRIEEQRTACNVQAAAVPSQETLDRLLRYEAHLSREFDRTWNQLEREQRRRLDQPVPPPVKVDLS